MRFSLILIVPLQKYIIDDMKKFLIKLSTFCCVMTMVVFTACKGDNDDNPAIVDDDSIVGNWYSNVSGNTCALWNYGDTWQNSVFNDDGTGYTRIYYTYQDKVIGCEKIDFTYTAVADGTLTMTPTNMDVINA